MLFEEIRALLLVLEQQESSTETKLSFLIHLLLQLNKAKETSQLLQEIGLHELNPIYKLMESENESMIFKTLPNQKKFIKKSLPKKGNGVSCSFDWDEPRDAGWVLREVGNGLKQWSHPPESEWNGPKDTRSELVQ